MLTKSENPATAGKRSTGLKNDPTEIGAERKYTLPWNQGFIFVRERIIGTVRIGADRFEATTVTGERLGLYNTYPAAVRALIAAVSS
jgi:hypothetical protein